MKLLAGLIALFLIPGSAISFWDGILLVAGDSFILKYSLIGIVSGGIIYLLLIRRWNHFLTFEHELTHAFMALLFFRKIHRFIATKNDGGVVYHSSGFGGEFGDIMITMAPYFFLTFTMIALLFQPLIPQKYLSVYIWFIGFTFIFHHLSTIRELKINWNSDTFPEALSGRTRITDIASSGFVFSFIFILSMTLLFNALTFWLLKYSYSGFVPFVKEVFSESLNIYKIIFIKLSSIILSIIRSL
jgi:hypothetical protein